METKQAEETKHAEQLAGAGGALATKSDNEAAQTLTKIVWDAAKIAVMKREICPAGITDDEFAIFLEKCRRSQMDPLLGEADCVPRRVKLPSADPNAPAQYVTKHVFQVREQGMEARADRFADFRGIEGEAVYSKDVFRFNAAAKTVVHEFDVTKPRGELLGAWARGTRDGREPRLVYLAFEERAVYYGSRLAETWVKMGATMIRKCARFDVLKLLYPNTYGGLTIDAEYTPPEEKEVNAAPSGGGSSTERLAGKMKKKAGDVFPFAGKVGGVDYFARPMIEVPDEVLTRAVTHYSGKIDADPAAADAAGMAKSVELCRAELGKRGKPVPPGPKTAPPVEVTPAPAGSSTAADVAKGGGIEDAEIVEEPGANG